MQAPTLHPVSNIPNAAVSPVINEFRNLASSGSLRRIGDIRDRVFALLDQVYAAHGATVALIELRWLPRGLSTDSAGRNLTASRIERWLGEVAIDDLPHLIPAVNGVVVVMELLQRGEADRATALAAHLRSEALRRTAWETVARLDSILLRQALRTSPIVSVFGQFDDALSAVPSNQHEARNLYVKLADDLFAACPRDPYHLRMLSTVLHHHGAVSVRLVRTLNDVRLAEARALVAAEEIPEAIDVCELVITTGESNQLVNAALIAAGALAGIGRADEAEPFIRNATLRTIDSTNRKRLQFLHARILDGIGATDESFALLDAAFANATLFDALDPDALQVYERQLSARGNPERARWAHDRAAFEIAQRLATGETSQAVMTVLPPGR